MSTEAGNATAHYLYAIADSREVQKCDCRGINGSPVYPISNGRTTVMVSDVPNAKMRPERRHLVAHHGVLKYLMSQATVLPMAFGNIVDGDDGIRGLLSRKEAAFIEQLGRVAGKVEMGLRVAWDVPNIFEYFVHVHPELRTMRDRVFLRDREPSHEERIELGRIFERVLAEDRAASTGKVREVLSPHCFEIKENRPRNEQEVMNLACLVARDAIQAFEVGVLSAARLFDDSFTFDYSGPWAPHNFAELDLSP